jgi:hypothetical protein
MMDASIENQPPSSDGPPDDTFPLYEEGVDPTSVSQLFAKTWASDIDERTFRTRDNRLVNTEVGRTGRNFHDEKAQIEVHSRLEETYGLLKNTRYMVNNSYSTQFDDSIKAAPLKVEIVRSLQFNFQRKSDGIDAGDVLNIVNDIRCSADEWELGDTLHMLLTPTQLQVVLLISTKAAESFEVSVRISDMIMEIADLSADEKSIFGMTVVRNTAIQTTESAEL